MSQAVCLLAHDDDATNPTQGNAGFTASDDYNSDPMGNRTTVINSASGTTSYTPNDVNQYTLLNSVPHTHNANGAMTSDGSSFYTWDSEDRLVSTVPTGAINGRKTVAYLYDAFHRRLAKARIGGSGVETVVRYSYDQWNPILEIEHFSGTILETRPLVWGPDVSRSLQGAGGVGGLIARGHTPGAGGSTVWHFHHYDGNGNVTATTNASGTVDATYRYDAFGNVLASTGSYAAANSYRFSTKPVDDECVVGGLAYYGYRYYHLALGRWGSRDPIGENGGVNLYNFLENAPVTLYDVMGLDIGCIDSGCHGYLIQMLTYEFNDTGVNPTSKNTISFEIEIEYNCCKFVGAPKVTRTTTDRVLWTGSLVAERGPTSYNGKTTRASCKLQPNDACECYKYEVEYKWNQGLLTLVGIPKAVPRIPLLGNEMSISIEINFCADGSYNTKKTSKVTGFKMTGVHLSKKGVESMR